MPLRRRRKLAAIARGLSDSISAQVKIERFLKMGVLDVHDSIFTLPETVYILAAGPNGKDVYNKIPKDACIIAVNRAAAIPDVPKPYIWMVADHTATKKRYFKQIWDSFDGLKVFSISAANRVKSYGVMFSEKHFVFNLIPKQRRGRGFKPVERCFQINGTVAGDAIWLTYIKGCSKVILVGVDLSGDKDFTGEFPEDGRKHGDIWNSAKRLDEQIEYQKKQGMSVISLSETKLKSVEVQDGRV